MMPSVTAPAARAFVQMAISKNLPDGSKRVADAIDALVARERAARKATANREASQLEPIAAKLRTRTKSKA